MIHNISRHFSKILALHPHFIIAKRTPTQSLFASMLLKSQNKFSFSTQNQNQNDEPANEVKSDAFSPIDYYRNTIRRVNIKANGRGKFTPYFLQKIINMAKNQEHAKIMFEAYFNYMGHFTQIPNKVVDSLVFKSITIGNQVEQLLEIFSNHNYLAYFPHYDATNRFIKHLIATQNHEGLDKMFRILIRAPLIKINAKTVQVITDHFTTQQCQPTTRQYILKVLLFRRKIVDGINQEDLLSKISAALQKNQAGPFEAKPMVRTSLTQLLNDKTVSTQDSINRLILASTYELIEQTGSLIAKEQQQIGAEHERFFNYLTGLYQRSSQQSNYGTTLKQILSEAKLSINNSETLQKLVNGAE